MAVKKETAQQAAEAATQDDKASQGVQAEKPATEVIHLFKDNGRYSSARFVSVNGEAYLIQRGVDAEVLRHSEEMDNAANAKIEAAQAAAQNVPALQKL